MSKNKSDAAARLARLVKVAERIEGYAYALAVTLGDFHGTNDFARTKPTPDNGFVLDEIQRDLIAMVVLRTSALLSSASDSTDATLTVARRLATEPGVQDEIIKEARRWIQGDDHFARINEKAARKKLVDFLSTTAALDGKKLNKHRNFVLAHSTTKKPPAVLFKDVWDIAAAALRAADDLVFFALGKDRNLGGISTARREQARDFWKIIARADQ